MMTKVAFEGEDVDATILPGPVGYYWGKLGSEYSPWSIFYWDGQSWSGHGEDDLNPNLVNFTSYIPTPDGGPVSD
jgi:hypothetical protein